MRSGRLFALLLRLYPTAFRAQFGCDMGELFADQLRAARREAGAAGVARLWLRVLPALARTALLERVEAAATRRRSSHHFATAAGGRRHEMIGTLRNDLRHALRLLRKNPLFTAVAVLVIALGSGGVTTVFSAMNAVLLRPLPGTAEPARLVDVERTQRDGSGSLSASYAYYETLLAQARSLDGVAAWSKVDLAIATDGEAMAAAGNIVSGNYFDVLGVRPALGRFFLPEEDGDPLSHPVIVVSHALWRDRLGADPAISGKALSVNGQRFTVVGVAPPDFTGVFTPLRVDAWVPLQMQPLLRPGRDLADPAAAWLRVFGRLAAGVEPAAARAELAALTAAYAAGGSEAERFRAFDGVAVRPMTGLPADAHRAALGFSSLLLGAAGLVLLIASVNVAAMLAARTLGRRREMAVRAALGAARSRLVRHLLTETLVLFGLGALGGMAVAQIATGALERLSLPGDVAIVLELSPDLRVLGFALAVALLTGLVCGLAPALQAARQDLSVRLREGSQASGTRRSLLGNTLVVGQLGLSLLLLVAAGLFLRALERGRAIDPGFAVAGVVTASFDTISWGYDEERGRRFFAALRERLEGLPGVTAVSTSGFLPLAFGRSGGEIEAGGVTVPIERARVDHGYFEVLRLPIVAGRAFTATDDERAPRVAVINETLAQRQWPGGDALGSTFTSDGEPVRVIGIARDAKYASLAEATPAFVYLPTAQSWIGDQKLLVRTAGEPLQLAPAIRSAVLAIDPTLPPPAVTTLERETSVALLPQQVAAWVTGLLGALGLLLAAVGLYGLMAYAASRRSREIGIRMALGARRGEVVATLLRQGLSLAAMGVIVGLLLAALATRLLAGLLFGLSPLDAATFAGMAALFLAVAAVATWLPARHAAAVEPRVVLGGE